MTYHDRLGMVVMFGGSDLDGAVTNTLWGWDGDNWHMLSADGPEARLHAAMAYDVARDRLVVHGGIRDRESSFSDTWEWDGTDWTEYRADVNGTDPDALPAIPSSGVQDAPPVTPGTRDHHAMAYDRARGVTVLFGGQDENDDHPADTWEWDGVQWLIAASEGPEPRGTHRMVWADSPGRVTLVAGWGRDGVLGDMWEWDGEAWSEVVGPGPGPRGATRFAWDAFRGQIVLFGGLVGGQPDGETWIRDSAGWRRAENTGPGPRNVHAMAWDPARRRVVLYGGVGEQGKLDDLWEWDGESWLRRH